MERVSHKVLDFSATLRRDVEGAGPPPKEKKTEKPLPSAVMLSGTDFLSTRVASRKPRDFVSKNSPPRAPVATGLPPVESYKSRKLRQWEKEQSELQRQLVAAKAAAEAVCSDDENAPSKMAGEDDVLARIPQKLLVKVLSKERQRQVFFAGVSALSSAPEASMHSLEENVTSENDHRHTSSWMDSISSAPVPESLFAYAKRIESSRAAAAHQSTEWFSEKDNENQPQVSKPTHSVTPLMLALQRRRASASITSLTSPTAAATSNSTSPSSPQSPKRLSRDASHPPPMYLRSVSTEHIPSIPENQRASSPSRTASHQKPAEQCAEKTLNAPCFANVASDYLAFNSGMTLSHTEHHSRDDVPLHEKQNDVLRGRSSWRTVTDQQPSIDRDFWTCVEVASSGDLRDSGHKSSRIIGRPRSNSIRIVQTLGERPGSSEALSLRPASPAAHIVQPKAAATEESRFQLKEMAGKHRKMLWAIEEQEKQWSIPANSNISFDIMDENGDGKCTFRDLAMWVRRNHHELHRLPVLLHAFQDTIGTVMSSESFVSRERFPKLLTCILHAARAWVLFDCMAGNSHTSKGDGKVLSKECFVHALKQLCEDLHADDIDGQWQNLSECSSDTQAGVTFMAFCTWLSTCEHWQLQQMLNFCKEPRGKDDEIDPPAAYSIVKPHILNMKETSRYAFLYFKRDVFSGTHAVPSATQEVY